MVSKISLVFAVADPSTSGISDCAARVQRDVSRQNESCNTMKQACSDRQIRPMSLLHRLHPT